MNLVELTKAQIRKAYIDPETRPEVVASLIEYAKITAAGKNIPQHIYDFLHDLNWDELLRGTGYSRCQSTGQLAKTSEMKGVYSHYRNFVNEQLTYMCPDVYEKTKRNGSIFTDAILGVEFYERSFTIVDHNFETSKISSSHAEHLLERNELFATQAARRTKIYTPFPTNFYGYGHAPKDWAIPEGDTIGIEIEMLFPSLENKIRFSSWVGQNFPGWVCEYDGSLEDHGNAGDCGLELISPPLLFDTLTSQSKVICEKALELGGKGFPAGVYYGMHVSVQIPKSRNPSRTVVGSRYIAFWNLPALRPFWQLVARRKGPSFETYSPFKNVRVEDCLQSERGDGDRHAHRRAVFVRNNSVLETRVFRSSLSPIQVHANIEICTLVMKYCASAQFSLTDIRPFYNFLHANMSSELRRCLYRKKNTPIKVLNDLMSELEIGNADDEELLNK